MEEIGIEVEGKELGEIQPELYSREGYRNKIEKHQWRRQEKAILTISEEEQDRRERMKRFWEERKRTKPRRSYL